MKDKQKNKTERNGLEKDMEKTIQKSLTMTRGLTFVMQMKPENDWHYAGKGVKLGEVTPICWWKPEGSYTYRVIYGDLTWGDVEPSQLPEVSETNVRE